MGKVMTFFEIMCLELLGFKKILVKYFICGVFSVLSDSEAHCAYHGCSSEQNQLQSFTKIQTLFKTRVLIINERR